MYDPATNQWSSAGDLKHFTFEATSTLLDSGEVMVLSDQGVDIYNPESNKWRQEEAPHFVARHGHTATRLDSGKILITGGGNGINLNSTALYNPSGPEPKWVQGPPLNQRNWNHQAILLPDGKVLVIGGFGGVELYTPTEPPEPQLPWIELAKDLGPYKYNKSSAILLPNNKVLLTAGTDEDIPSAIFTIPAH
ncbi:hypothetical protein BON30_34255 [Cystobacter ferrugineus]|uniref:Galactose oxidase n=1 Tax=Cystobacter ferrugineus TaxID=83449 RepID=A0A1L9B1U0_9BACT|nr:hypothetical protein BON30_34255 [Cystobacter ferrugineus]